MYISQTSDGISHIRFTLCVYKPIIKHQYHTAVIKVYAAGAIILISIE